MEYDVIAKYIFVTNIWLLQCAKVVNVEQMCGYEEENSCFIGKNVIKIVVGGMLHSRVINKGYVSLTITKSYNDNPPITTIGTAKGHFVICLVDCQKLYEAT